MGILEFILIIIVLFWLGGSAFHIGGDLIHLLLVVAVVVLVYKLLKGRNIS